jgi:cysteine desulfurase / selenocysteine lyase
MNRQFPVIDNLIHLNHAAVGPWPQQTAEVVKQFAEENARQGSLDYLQWLEVETQLRENIKTLINASSADEIALVKNTSEGLSFVAYGVDWKEGDNVVGIQQEFPSNRFVWESLASQGVEFRKLDMQGQDDPEQALFDLCDGATKLISISAVQYYNGYRMDLEKVGSFCREHNILFCVDAIQQIGALPFDVQAIGADFAMADGHKWMLAPEGLGLFYIRREVIERLGLCQYGWRMTEKLEDYSQQDFKIQTTARRFECGSPNMMGIHALNSSLQLLLENGMQNIGGRVTQRTRYLIDGLNAINNIRLYTDTSEQRISGIVTFGHRSLDNQQLYKLLTHHSVLCAPRGGGVRLSPHFYTPFEQLDKVLALIHDFTN